MLTKIQTAVIRGVQGIPVTLETDITFGLPIVTIVGLADASVKEAKERVRSAVINSGFSFSTNRITMNLSPADVHKNGTHLDLPMAVSILISSGEIKSRCFNKYALFGELSLDGNIRKVNGILAMVRCCKELGVKRFIVPRENAQEAAMLDGIEIYPADCLKQITEFLEGKIDIVPGKRTPFVEEPLSCDLDFSDVRGREMVKRAVCVAVAGGHGMLMTGSPATGKTMVAERVPGILPPLTAAEQMELTEIYSICGLLEAKQPVVGRRPFRQPHSSLSTAGLIGGGNKPRPGEVTLAHHGVLFLDELPEFSPAVLDSLRTPLDRHKVQLNRGGETFVFPADFLFIAAANPCPCGYYGEGDRCKCSKSDILRYQKRISGPLLSRIDIHIFLPCIEYEQLQHQAVLDTKTMREMVLKAREIQRKRFSRSRISLNAQMNKKQLQKYASLTEDAEGLLASAYYRLQMNPRVMDKTIKVARTIADLEGCEEISRANLTEALAYRKG